MNAIDDMLRNPRFTLDSLSDAQIAVLHQKIDSAWHRACAAFAGIYVANQDAFSAMSGMISELAEIRSDTFRQVQARAERFARGI